MRVFKDVSMCTLNILKVMCANFKYAWETDIDQILQVLTRQEIMIHNVDMPLLF